MSWRRPVERIRYRAVVVRRSKEGFELAEEFLAYIQIPKNGLLIANFSNQKFVDNSVDRLDIDAGAGAVDGSG